MYTTLLPGAIGISEPLLVTLRLAARYGFEACHIDISEASVLGVNKVRDFANECKLRLSSFTLPVDFRVSKSAYSEDLAKLPELAALAASLGISRTSTYILPSSENLTYRQNFDLHVRRLKPVAQILNDHGLRLGLEYVGPKTMWSAMRYPFIHTMVEMEELSTAVGPNTGLLLDCFHWYTAEETIDDIAKLSLEQIVEVHLNDAPDCPIAEQLDGVRDLPGTTGVIPISTFLCALKDLGFDGPIGVEPFKSELLTMTAEEACLKTSESLMRFWPPTTDI
jgi:sugar phosphate isomerase/epimerase